MLTASLNPYCRFIWLGLESDGARLLVPWIFISPLRLDPSQSSLKEIPPVDSWSQCARRNSHSDEMQCKFSSASRAPLVESVQRPTSKRSSKPLVLGAIIGGALGGLVLLLRVSQSYLFLCKCTIRGVARSHSIWYNEAMVTLFTCVSISCHFVFAIF